MADYPLLKKRTYTGVNFGELTSFEDCTLFADKKVKFIEVGLVSSQESSPLELSSNIEGIISKVAMGEIIPTEDESFSIYKAFETIDGHLKEIPLKGRGAQGYINKAPEAALLIHLLDLNC